MMFIYHSKGQLGVSDVIMMSYLLVCSDWSIALRW